MNETKKKIIDYYSSICETDEERKAVELLEKTRKKRVIIYHSFKYSDTTCVHYKNFSKNSDFVICDTLEVYRGEKLWQIMMDDVHYSLVDIYTGMPLASTTTIRELEEAFETGLYDKFLKFKETDAYKRCKERFQKAFHEDFKTQELLKDIYWSIHDTEIVNDNIDIIELLKSE